MKLLPSLIMTGRLFGLLGSVAVVCLSACTPVESIDAEDDLIVVPAAGEPAELVRVIDGDSVELLVDGREVEVRLLGVNAPELYGSAAGGGYEAGRLSCNGEAARHALRVLLDREDLRVAGDETDRFGRLLADVTAGGRSASEDMVGLGWGLATGDGPGLRDAMKQAAAERAGMWGDLCGTPSDTGLAVGETQVDPRGSDRENLNDEWVTIVNNGQDAVDLAGWEISDDTSSNSYVLESVLPAGGTLTVRTGSGSSTATDFYLNERSPVWSNRGETVLILDPEGVVTAWAFIDPPGGS